MITDKINARNTNREGQTVIDFTDGKYVSIEENAFTDLYPNNANQVEVLILANNRLTNIPNLSNLAHLHTLDLNSNQINRINSNYLPNSLRILSLHYNPINEISDLSHLNGLIYLMINHNTCIRDNNHIPENAQIYLYNREEWGSTPRLLTNIEQHQSEHCR
tara:strand:- start:275 stop:760 length:486 start_codon:yes stop_codon:yes gene_type:complete